MHSVYMSVWPRTIGAEKVARLARLSRLVRSASGTSAVKKQGEGCSGGFAAGENIASRGQFSPRRGKSSKVDAGRRPRSSLPAPYSPLERGM